MKKLIITACVALSSLAAMAIGPDWGFNHLAVGAGVGTTGIQIEAATTITSWVNMRAGVAILPNFTFSTDADADLDTSTGTVESTIDLTGGLGRTQGLLIFNFYPIPKHGFYIAAGAYFGGNRIVSIKGYSPDLASVATQGVVNIGDFGLPISPEGKISGGIKVNGFRPYLGIGWGRSVPNNRINFNIDLGVQFHGKPKLFTDYGTIEDITKNLDDEDDFTKILDKVKIWPVLTFRISGKIF